MQRILALFNNLGVRERLGVILALAAALYFTLDLALISPEQERHKTLKAALAKTESELTSVRGDIVIVKAQLEKDPHAKDRAQLDAYRKAIDEAANFLAQVETDPAQVSALLRQLLSATPGLTLVSLKTLPPVAVVDMAKGGAAGKEASARTVYRRGVQLSVKGNYLALLPYLEKLQALPTRVLWSDARLDVQTYPDATLSMTIYTLGADAEGKLG